MCFEAILLVATNLQKFEGQTQLSRTDVHVHYLDSAHVTPTVSFLYQKKKIDRFSDFVAELCATIPEVPLSKRWQGAAVGALV